jgi:mannose-6-phosphate isomerase
LTYDKFCGQYNNIVLKETRLNQERPIFLSPNLVGRSYRGGQRLALFRGADIGADECVPEEWLASTTNVKGQPDIGPSVLPDGRRVKDVIAADPESYLGPAHVEVFGSDPALLVKLLDAQQRLSVHLHPTRQFVRTHLGTRYGKCEAWYILATEPDSGIHFGFREGIEANDLSEIVQAGEGAELISRMNHVRVAAGDSIFVPGGVPHAIGSGVFMIELQEPSDLLVRLEWSGYAVGAIPHDLGLGFPTALQAVDRSRWDSARLESVITRAHSSDRPVLPKEADAFFRLERPASGTVLAEGFRIVIVTEGKGELGASGWSLPIEKGQCLLLPWANGSVELQGNVKVVCCRPADPSAARMADPDLAKYH